MLWESLIAVAVLLVLAAIRSEALSPRVTTDRSVDCHSLASIVADVCAGKSTRQEKAVALYEFVRRVMFHYAQRSDRDRRDNLDSLRLINTYGYSFCSQQMLVLVSLWRAAGIEGKVWSLPGHGTAHARYGRRLHWFDPLIGAYVYGRDGKTVASLPDIAKDPALLTRAAEEGRASPTFLPCGTVLLDDAARFCRHDPKYVRRCRELVDDATFIATLAGKSGPWKWGDPSRPRFDPDLRLRRGESILFLWDNLPGEVNCRTLKPRQRPRSNVVPRSQLPPHHFCGLRADRKDVVNYKYWRPYAKVINGVKTCRYYANGRQVYRPDLAQRPARGDFQVNTFVRAAPNGSPPALRVARAGRASVLVCKMSIPHAYTSATVTAEFRRAARDDLSCIHFSRDGKGKWVKLWDAADRKPAAGKVLAAAKLREDIVGARELWFRFKCRTAGAAEKAGLNALRIEAIFQHNMFARPYLLAGRNRVTVRTRSRETLGKDSLAVTYSWKQGRTRRTHTKRITASPTTYAIDVAGKEAPRMVSLEIALGG